MLLIYENGVKVVEDASLWSRQKQEISQYRLCQVLQLYETSDESSLIYSFEISVVLLQPGRLRLRAVSRNIICRIKMRESSTSGLLST